MELRKLIGLALGGGMIVAGSMIPANAHGPIVCVVAAQNAFVTNTTHAGKGLYYPVTDPTTAHWTTTKPNPYPGGLLPAFTGDNYTWSLNGGCANGGTFASSGTGVGYCGRSVGYGTGTGFGGHSYITQWESAGSQLIVHNTTPNKTNVGTVNAQANPPGSADGSCLDGTAKKFLVDGALVHN